MWKIFSFLKMFREDLLIMMVALKDSRTPAAIKAAFLIGLLYCISPIDIIPDAVPVLGMVDDAAVLPAAVFGLIRFLPPQVRADAQVKAERLGRRLPYIVALASIALIAWIALIVWGIVSIFR